MSRASVLHVYEVTAIMDKGEDVSEWGNAKIGGYLVADKHVRKHHEPERQWDYLDGDMKVNSKNPFTSIVAKHLGEYEKVKHLLENGGTE